MPVTRLFPSAALRLTTATADTQSPALDGSRHGTIAGSSGAERVGANLSATFERSSAPCLPTAACWFLKEQF